MKTLEKFKKYPFVTVAVFVGLGLLLLYALADVFGSEWLAMMIEQQLGVEDAK